MAEVVERAQKPAVFGPGRGEQFLRIVHALIGEGREDGGGAQPGCEIVLGRHDLEGEPLERDGRTGHADQGREERCVDATPDQDGQPRDVLPALRPQ